MTPSLLRRWARLVQAAALLSLGGLLAWRGVVFIISATKEIHRAFCRVQRFSTRRSIR